MWQKVLQSGSSGSNIEFEIAHLNDANTKLVFDRKNKPTYAAMYQSKGASACVFDKINIGENLYKKGGTTASQTLTTNTTTKDTMGYNTTDGLFYIPYNTTDYKPYGFAIWEN